MTQLIAENVLSGQSVRPWAFYGRWMLANSLAELIGLGASALLWIAFSLPMETTLGVLAGAAITVIGSTLLEGTAVGLGQWLVLRQALPKLPLRAWFVATAAGAFVAWTLGMVPSTLMQLMADETAAPAGAEPQISDLLMYSLAALMGLVLGPILAAFQWRALRGHVERAWRWIPANALAWAAGMVIIFAVVGNVPYDGPAWASALAVLAGLAVAGAVVGAIHGLVLLRMVQER